MYIAINKRRENIAEYILYLWQLEDMMRALQFSPEAIYSQLIEPRGMDAIQGNELLVWYMDICTLLRQEGKAENGHLEHTLHLIADLQSLHDRLMEIPAGQRYRTLYSRLMPELPRLRSLAGKQEANDIELCFRALYAVMLYRMKGDSVAEKAAADVIELVSPAVAELACLYRQAETGEFDLSGEEA